MEFLFELLFEFLLQIVGEVLVELGLHTVAAPFRRESHPALAAVGYAFFGALLGAGSLWLVPHHMVRTPLLRAANLVVTPLAVGVCMSCLGAWRARRGQAVYRIDRLWYGALFAFSFAAVRFVWAS